MKTLQTPRDSSQSKIHRTSSFRLSSTKIMKKWGGNRQNVDSALRSIYIPDDGKIFLQPDQAGAEALIVAYLCRDGNFRRLFKNNIKPHTYTALHVFSKVWRDRSDPVTVLAAIKSPIDAIPSLPKWKDLNNLIKSSDNWPGKQRYYFLGKKLVHAGNYGMKARRFASSLLEETQGIVSLSVAEAEEYQRIYFTLFPEILFWQCSIETIMKEAKVRNEYPILRNLFGYPRIFTKYISDHVIREGLSFIPQSTVAVITHKAFTSAQEYIEKERLDWDLLLNTHDGLLMQVPIDERDEAKKRLKEFMELELTAPDGTAFRMKIEVKAGFNWGPYDEKDNPQGLQEI